MENHPAWPQIKSLVFAAGGEQIDLAITLAEAVGLSLEPLVEDLLDLLDHAECFPKLAYAHLRSEPRILFRLPYRYMALSLEDYPLPRAVLGLFGQLRVLELYNNGLSALPWGLHRLQNLRSLSIRHNALSDLCPDTLGSLKQLTNLLLQNNPLMALPKVLLDLPHLQVLGLAHTDLAELPCFLSQMPSLQRIILDRRRYVDLPDWLEAKVQIDYED